MASFNMRTLLAVIFVLALVSHPQAATIKGTARIIDGDTLDVGGQRIRLHGIDSPESAQTCKLPGAKQWRCGQEAANALSDFIDRRPVTCDGRGQDAYGRTIAICRVNGIELNRWLVKEGWAVAYRKYSEDYVDAEAEARAEGMGIWATTFEMPWDFRNRRWAGAAGQAPDPDCPIKGNINGKGDRIYHTPWGSRDYDRTVIDTSKGERWFCDEAEAVAAGWRAPYN